jgi:hypothetical protein
MFTWPTLRILVYIDSIFRYTATKNSNIEQAVTIIQYSDNVGFR